ncbi:hypothetical protein WDJ51_02155 [Rathayibacter sp. YIM 133350]|uniref:hypothetical protein n=1 Tax=Rathayibacter sp. YIM 133350 TaxID=3131992 RepID=UPI00307D681A
MNPRGSTNEAIKSFHSASAEPLDPFSNRTLGIHVMLFNRPEYAEQTLTSLRDQVPPVAVGDVVISIDGYQGSKDEFEGRPDRTGDVRAVAEAVLPGARVQTHRRNIGIARHFAEVEERAFAGGDPWALFLEEDFVLEARYVSTIRTLIRHVHSEQMIVAVSATGDTRSPRIRAEPTLYPMDHAWAFALRREHYLGRRAIVDAYLEIMEGDSYFRRPADLRNRLPLISEPPLGTSQDAVKQAIRRSDRKLAVTTGYALGRYVGREGEHFTEELFASMGYGEPAVAPDSAKVPVVDSRLVDTLIWDEAQVMSEQSRSIAQGQIDEVQARCEDAQNESTRLRRENAQLIDSCDSLREELRQSQLKYRERTSEIGALTASRSWRMTRPLRAFSSWARRTGWARQGGS